MNYYYSPKANVLLMPQTNEQDHIRYDNNPFTWETPRVGTRPPYYTNPSYEQYYPVI